MRMDTDMDMNAEYIHLVCTKELGNPSYTTYQLKSVVMCWRKI